MAYSAARARWRARLDFYSAAGAVLPEVHPIDDEDWAAMQAEAAAEEPKASPRPLRRFIAPAPAAAPARPKPLWEDYAE